MIIHDDTYTRVYDMGDYWVLEDKTKINKPVIRQVQIGSADPPEDLEPLAWPEPTGVWADLTRSNEGLPAVVRWYFPKDFPRDDVLRLAKGLSESYQRKLAEAQRILEKYG